MAVSGLRLRASWGRASWGVLALTVATLGVVCMGSFVSRAQEPAAKAQSAPQEAASGEAAKADAAAKEEAAAKPEGAKTEKPKSGEKQGDKTTAKGTAEKGTAEKGTAEKGTEKTAEKPVVKPAVKRPTGPTPNFSPEREAAALAFAKQHHEELVALLAALKERNRKEYERAIGELWRTSERLALSREKDPDRHALELADWKLNSRIQLLAARLTMTKSKSVEEDLRSAIKDQTEVRIKVLELDRDRTAARLKKLEEQIGAATSGVDAEVDRRMGNLLNQVSRTRQKAAERNAAKTAESKSATKPIEKKASADSFNAAVEPKVAPK